MIKIYESPTEVVADDVKRYCVHVKLNEIETKTVRQKSTNKIKAYSMLHFIFKSNDTITLDARNIKYSSGVWKEEECYILYFRDTEIAFLRNTTTGYVNPKTLELIAFDGG